MASASSSKDKNNNNNVRASTTMPSLVPTILGPDNTPCYQHPVTEVIKPVLGSFPRTVGPAADIRELEYISALHQNAESYLRLDGTICSKDIAPYLSSKYGMEITPEQALDIAVNLCGAKLRSELSKEKDGLLQKEQARAAQDLEEMDVPMHQPLRKSYGQLHKNHDPLDHAISPQNGNGKDSMDKKKSGDSQLDVNGEEEEEEEKVYYFDLVQVMSLLLIGELVELSERHEAQCGGHNQDNNLHLTIDEIGGQLQLMDLVMKSLTEVLEERVQHDIFSGSQRLDKETLSVMLESFGDVDAAYNDDLLRQMLGALGSGSSEDDGETAATFTAETFLRALTADVTSFSAQKKKLDKNYNAVETSSAPVKTSTFYDVFGRNWENEGDDDHTEGGDKKGSMGKAPQPQQTASSIDYAADSYGSILLNTAVWSLFLMTTLVYLNFFLTLLDAKTSEAVCPIENDNLGCVVGNKVFGWILTAFFCGFYGVSIIVPTSIGNVAGKSPMLYVTLVVTALYTYAPFTTLAWYRTGIPYTVERDIQMKVVCPSWIGDLNETRRVQNALNEAEIGSQYYMRLDRSCQTVENWCTAHPEIQGKYIDLDRNFLSYDEFEKCYSFYEERLDGGKFRKYLWEQTGGPCDPFNITSTCPDKGNCGLRTLANADDPLFEEDYICCHSGYAIPFQSTRYKDSGNSSLYDTVGNVVCADQGIGLDCLDNSMCENGAICAPNNTCVVPEELKGESGWLGSQCNRSNSDCQSGFCWNGTCNQKPTICPAPGVEVFGGLRIDPFCRTFDDWCEYTNLNEIQSSFENIFGLSFASQGVCGIILNLTVDRGIMMVIDESDAEIGYIYNTTIYNATEEVLIQDWALLVLLSIAVVGCFALLAILRKMFMQHAEERPRDYSIKYAASCKLTNVIENAAVLHTQGSRGNGHVMRNFFLSGEERKEVGGLVWTFKNLLSGCLSSTEGIKYPGRIWVGQVSQIVVTIIGIVFAVRFILRVGEEIDERRQDLGRSFTQEELRNVTNEDWATFTIDDLSVTAEEQAQLDLLPERWMFDVAAIVGAVFGLFVAIFCILLYLPSTTNMILKLRNGQLPSLHDPLFGTYRNSPDNVVSNIGNMVFALMGAAVFMSVLIFGLVFVFTYQNTRPYALNYVGVAIGIICTMVIKIMGQKTLRKRNWSCFYRKKPKTANYANLFFECWAISTGLLVVVSRIIMFLLSSALWLGRIDVEFLDPSVKIGKIRLDKLPTSFKRDILVHEAHSHPYIERLGAMYLLRLRDGDQFGSIVGTTWRSLFVAGLMPWIVKHRVNSSDGESNLQKAVGGKQSRDSELVKSKTRRTSNVSDPSMKMSTNSPENVRRSYRSFLLPSDEKLRSSRRASFAGFKDDSERSIVSI